MNELDGIATRLENLLTRLANAENAIEKNVKVNFNDREKLSTLKARLIAAEIALARKLITEPPSSINSTLIQPNKDMVNAKNNDAETHPKVKELAHVKNIPHHDKCMKQPEEKHESSLQVKNHSSAEAKNHSSTEATLVDVPEKSDAIKKHEVSKPMADASGVGVPIIIENNHKNSNDATPTKSRDIAVDSFDGSEAVKTFEVRAPVVDASNIEALVKIESNDKDLKVSSPKKLIPKEEDPETKVEKPEHGIEDDPENTDVENIDIDIPQVDRNDHKDEKVTGSIESNSRGDATDAIPHNRHAIIADDSSIGAERNMICCTIG